MYRSGEASARAVIQKIRPGAIKHGLKRGIVEAYLREHLPEPFRKVSWEKMKSAPEYEYIREEAEHYRPHFLPDLCEIYPDDREIILFEIEASNRVSAARLELIEYWQGVTMDGWDWWDVLLVTTNRFGFGWDVILDTKQSSRAFALYQLRNRAELRRKYYPELMTVESINARFRWRNWSMPPAHRFRLIRDSIARQQAGRLARRIEAWEKKRRQKN